MRVLATATSAVHHVAPFPAPEAGASSGRAGLAQLRTFDWALHKPVSCPWFVIAKCHGLL